MPGVKTLDYTLLSWLVRFWCPSDPFASTVNKKSGRHDKICRLKDERESHLPGSTRTPVLSAGQGASQLVDIGTIVIGTGLV